MATNRTKITRFLLLGFLACSIATAAPLRVETFSEAIASAQNSKRPVAVYVHGSSWHGASRTFKEMLWDSEDFTKQLTQDAILTEIHIGQNIDEKNSKAAEAQRKDWSDKAIHSYPAVQIYASDGFLLKTIQGREIRVTTSAAALATNLNAVLEAASRRRELLAETASIRSKNGTGAEISQLVELIELPINRDPALVEQLKQADPADQSGWQARLSFGDWRFIRQVNSLIDAKKPDQALAEADKLLQSERFDPAQRALILGARGMALVAKNDLIAAWDSFEKARETDPEGANGNAVWRYGVRIAGTPLRVVVPPDSELSGKEIGENISRDHATYTVSSTDSEDSARHATLFAGAPAESGFAFHTKQEKGAHIVIDLQADCEIRALHITNRAGHIGRAESLTLWTSENGRKWKKTWNAEKSQPTWDVLLEKPTKARYLKLGLAPDRADYFHLRTVDIYGKRP